MTTEGSRAALALDKYRKFINELDTWFRSIRVKYRARMKCGKGCTLCCLGLFDIPLPDAIRVADGYRRLPVSLRNEVAGRAAAVHAEIVREAPELETPYFLGSIPEERIDHLTDVVGNVPCPFLGADGICLIYECRPMACVLEGMPMVDVRDGLFDDWCGYNFTDGVDPALRKDLALDYYEIQETVERIAKSLVRKIPAFPGETATLFVPSVVVSYDVFWKELA